MKEYLEWLGVRVRVGVGVGVGVGVRVRVRDHAPEDVRVAFEVGAQHLLAHESEAEEEDEEHQ